MRSKPGGGLREGLADTRQSKCKSFAVGELWVFRDLKGGAKIKSVCRGNPLSAACVQGSLERQQKQQAEH